jgi:HEAT repeat protein
MYYRRSAQYLLALVVWTLSLPLAANSDSNSADEQVLKAAGLTVEGPALLTFFRQRTQPNTEQTRMQSLIRQLAQGTSAQRVQAAGELVALGPAAVPLLRQAVKDPDDPDLVQRARSCLAAIDDPSLPAAAARLVGQSKPDGAAEVLLTYLPFADDEAVVDEVRTTLRSVGLRDGKPMPALLAALEDQVPIRRWVAAVALCQGGGVVQSAPVHKLLHDPKPNVRLQVALALGSLNEEDAIPVLIASLGELPPARARLAEDFLMNLAGEQAPAVSLSSDPSQCREAWAAWWRAADGSALLEFFRKRTLSDEQRQRIQALIRQLGDDAFAVREKASSELAAMGDPVAPLLRLAIKSTDVEIARRAEECLQMLDKTRERLTPVTATRLIAFRKPVGAAEALLNFLPFSEDDAMTETLQEALNSVSLRDGKVEPVLLQALDAPIPLRRAAAAEAICKAGFNLLQAVRKLLNDQDVLVRLRTARTLIHAKDRDAVPALIALLTELPESQTWQVTEILLPLAGDRAPAVEMGRDETSRRAYRDAWSSWWRTQGAAVDLGQLQSSERMLGYTLLVLSEPNKIMGRVRELGLDGKPRWEIANLRFPLDAHFLPGNRVLIAEAQGRGECVTERDLKGNILWSQRSLGAISCQRLPNGNTFIASRQQLIEVTRNHQEVLSIKRPAHDVLAAVKRRDGQIICVTSTGVCQRLDSHGRELRSFAAGPVIYGGLDVLSNDHILVAEFHNNRVVEFDPDGKVVWQALAARPNAAVRLKNGHTLVTCQAERRVYELDRNGKIVWDHHTEEQPLRARRR